MELELIPWTHFRAKADILVLKGLLEEIGKASVEAFRRGSSASGSKSSPGQYPAIQSGRLISSLSYTVSGNSLEVGTKVFYAIYLSGGTRKMARRKMSQDAMQEGMEASRSTFKSWMKWEYGEP